MDQSYITHQRRFAIIPMESCLAPEDEQAVRIRTGDFMPSMKFSHWPNQEHASTSSDQMTANRFISRGTPLTQQQGTKRKASTPSEDYKAMNADDRDELEDADLNNAEEMQPSSKARSSDVAPSFTQQQSVFDSPSDIYKDQGRVGAAHVCRSTSTCDASPKTAAAVPA